MQYGAANMAMMRAGLTKRTSDRQELIRSIRVSPIASIVTDPNAPDNPIIAVNERFEQLTGYTEGELVGRNCRVLAGPATERGRLATLSRAVASATPVVAELINYRKDGSTFVNAVMIAPVLDDDGELAYFVGSQMAVDSEQEDLARTAAVARIDRLTPQQQKVLRLMAHGMRNRQIGEELGLTEKTIKMHRGALVKRLGVSTAAEAMRLAIEAGF
jgi:PAS domain S-box-containing protein